MVALLTTSNYHAFLSLASARPSIARLLLALFLRPFPLFRAAKVGFNASQLGHISLRFFSTLFIQFPSMWSATSGTTLVLELTSAHPQIQHLLLYFPRKYFFTVSDTSPIEFSPDVLPFFQFST